MLSIDTPSAKDADNTLRELKAKLDFMFAEMRDIVLRPNQPETNILGTADYDRQQLLLSTYPAAMYGLLQQIYIKRTIPVKLYSGEELLLKYEMGQILHCTVSDKTSLAALGESVTQAIHVLESALQQNMVER